MTNQQAKEILMLFRPGTDDPADLEFAGALALAKGDPELGRWFDEHCQAREAIRVRFKAIAVPEGLKEQILAERKVHTTAFTKKRPSQLAVATAVLALLVGLASLWLRPREDKNFSGFRARMTSTVARAYPPMDLETNDLGQIQQYLAKNQAPGNYVLPPALAKTKGTGCAILTWQGKPVSMICFNSGKTVPAASPDLFLFIIDRSAVPNAPPGSSPQLAQMKHLATASWSSGDKTYVLAGNVEDLREFL